MLVSQKCLLQADSLLQADVQALLWNYSMGYPWPRTKPLPLIPLGD